MYLDRVEVTREELLAIGQSEEFRLRLGRSARTTMRTGHESAFSLYRHLERGRDYWSPVIKGSTDEVARRAFDPWKETICPDPLAEPGFYLLEIHVHPESREPLALSEDDVFLMDSSVSTYETRPLIGIGSIDEKKYGYVLLLQRTCRGDLWDNRSMVEQFWQNYQEAWDYWGRNGFARMLEVPGYIKADLLRFRLTTGSAHAEIANPGVLTRFAYTIDFPSGSC